MKKVVLIVTSDGFGGLGDFLFALKLAQNLFEQYMKTESASREIYIITQNTGKEKIKKINADTAFYVEDVLSTEELQQKINHRSIDPTQISQVIEGPVLATKLIVTVDRIFDRQIIPYMTISEYGDTYDKERLLNYRKTALHSLQWVEHVFSGFDHTRHERGILQMSKIYTSHEAINRLSSDLKDRLGLFDDSFFINNTLSLQYSHDEIIKKKQNIVLDQPAQRYLALHHTYYKTSNKNQVVVMIGPHREHKFKALKTIQHELIGEGFKKIIFFDTETQMETRLYDSTTSGKVYIVFYFSRIAYPTMISIMALSGPLVGVTGDQSLGECLQYGKIPVYETTVHKKDFIHHFEQRIYELSEQNPAIKRCLEILRPPLNGSSVLKIFEYHQDGAYIEKHKALLLALIQALLKQSHLIEGIHDAETTLIQQQFFYHLYDALVHRSNTVIQYYHQHHDILSPDTTTSVPNLSMLINRIGIINILEHYYHQYPHAEQMLMTIIQAILQLNCSYDAYKSILCWIFGRRLLNDLYQILFINLSMDAERALYDVMIEFDENQQLNFSSLANAPISPSSRPFVGAFYACVDHLIHTHIPDTATIRTHKARSTFTKLYQYLFNAVSKKDLELARHALIGFLLFHLKTHVPIVGFTPSSHWLAWSRNTTHVNEKLNKKILALLNLDHHILSNSQFYIRQYETCISILTEGVPNFKSGSDLSFYQIEKSPLGTGGWSVVYPAKAHHIGHIHRTESVAIKTSTHTELLLKEYDTLKKLYPSLYFDFFVDNKTTYLVMPRFQGKPLDHALLATQSQQNRLLIAIDLLKQLMYIHEQGFIHADLKPQNILFDAKNNHIRIIDFGCAQKIGPTSFLKYTTIDTALFAFEHPPEYHIGAAAHPAQDIYSLSIVLAEIFGANRNTLIQQRLNQTYQHIDPDLAGLIQSVFSKSEDIESAVFRIPLYKWRNHKAFEHFVKTYQYTKFDFTHQKNELGEKVIELLQNMQAQLPFERPSAKMCIDTLQRIKHHTEEKADAARLGDSPTSIAQNIGV